MCMSQSICGNPVYDDKYVKYCITKSAFFSINIVLHNRSTAVVKSQFHLCATCMGKNVRCAYATVG